MDQTRELCPGREAHDALFDAIGCAVLLEHVLGLEGWGGVTVEQLVNVQPDAYYKRVSERTRRRATS